MKRVSDPAGGTETFPLTVDDMKKSYNATFAYKELGEKDFKVAVESYIGKKEELQAELNSMPIDEEPRKLLKV